MIKRRVKLALALGALALTGSAAAVVAQSGQNWTTAVVERDNGHLLGNPEAKVKLVEFMSYTCSHCADFAREGEPGRLRLQRRLTGPRRAAEEPVRGRRRDPGDGEAFW